MDCSPKRLKSLVDKGDVEFDADIAGPGVLAAFLITSLIALATLILAFLTISVPVRLLNSGDAVIAAGARRTYRRLRAKFPKTKRTKVVESRTERTHAFTAFMIAISDQILVSQASILTAALVIHDDITLYSMNIVIALGCLASTVHLGSIPFSIYHIKDHSTAKLIRVLAMMTGSRIIIVLLVIQLSYNWDMETHVYFTCVLRDYRTSGKMIWEYSISFILQMFTPLTVLYGTYDVVQLLYHGQPVDDKAHGPESRNISPVARRSQSNHDRQQIPDNEGVELQRLARLEEQANQENHREPCNLEVEFQAIISVLQLISSSNGEIKTYNEADYQHQRSMISKPRGTKIKLKALLNEITESKREILLNSYQEGSLESLSGSFAWRLFWLWLGNVYGVLTVFASQVVTTGISGNPNKMGFGQVVTLTLLALPIFAALESHADYKKKLEEIEKAHVGQANLETPVNGEARSQSRGQSPAQIQNLAAEIDISSMKTVLDMLKEPPRDIECPELYNWVTGEELTSASSLQLGVTVHAAVIFTVTTLLGYSIAYGIPIIIILMILFLFFFAARKLIGLCLVGLDKTSYPMILDHLGCTGHLPSQQSGSHGETIAVAQVAEGAGEDLEDQGRQEEA